MLRKLTDPCLSPSSFWSRKAEEGLNFKAPFNLKELEKHISSDISKNACILDVGCGYGRVLDALYQQGYLNLHGVDVAEKMIVRGKREYPHLSENIRCSRDEERLPFKDQNFDLVILFSVLTCQIKDDNQIKLINEIKRVLKPGGLLYINDFLISNNEERRKHYEKTVSDIPDVSYGVFEVREGGGTCRHHTSTWLNKLLTEFNLAWFADKNLPTIGGNLDHPFQAIAKFNPGRTNNPIIPTSIELAIELKEKAPSYIPDKLHPAASLFLKMFKETEEFKEEKMDEEAIGSRIHPAYRVNSLV